MYRYLLLVTLLCTAHLSQDQKLQALAAQPPVSTAPLPAEGSYRFRLDSLTQALDKAQIPAGILYDRALPLAGLHTGVGSAQRGVGP